MNISNPIISHNSGNVFNVFVPGNPQSQGSMSAFMNPKTGRPIITSANKSLKPWRSAMDKVFVIARKQTGHQTITGPCKLQVTFFMPMLKEHEKPGKGRFWADTTMDLDKLVRAVNDSLQKSEVFVNDSRVCAIISYKRFSSLTDTPGVHVVVSPLPENGGPEEIPQNATTCPKGVKPAIT